MSNSFTEYTSITDLKTLEQGTPFKNVAVIKNIALKTARNGSNFLSVELGDRTGSYNVVCFNDSTNFLFFQDIARGDVVKVRGQIDYFQSRFSPKITSTDLVSAAELDKLADLLVASTEEDAGLLWEELQNFIEQIEHVGLRTTVENAMNDVGDEFRASPAGISMHHAYRGGLLEHTVHMCRAGKAMFPCYPEVDPDLTMCGIILHDIGKVAEYTGHMATTKTRKGILQGHVVLGYRQVRKSALQAKLATALTERLEHIILSHQGELQWGATALAATPEAVFVSMLDNLDAKMGMVQQALRSTPSSHEFSDFMPGLQSKLLTAAIDKSGDESAISEESGTAEISGK